MKKQLIAFMALAIAGNAYAYSVKMRNNTDGVVEVKITYGGAGVCGDDVISIQPGQTRVKNTGACCPKKFYVKALSGLARNKKLQHTPVLTGFGISCKSESFTVFNPALGALGVERGIIKKR